MMLPQHDYLLDPRNAKAYQVLCDCPRGSTPAWATKAGLTPSEMRTVINNLTKYGLADVVRVGNIRIFTPLAGVRESVKDCEGVSGCESSYLGSKSNCNDNSKNNSDNVPRYRLALVEKHGSPHADVDSAPTEADQVRLIEALNGSLSHKFDGWRPLPITNRGSLAAARKILAVVPVDRAEQLLIEAGWIFSPEKSGDELPRSLGHPFFVKYAINEWRRIQRELERGQLSMLLPGRTAADLPVFEAPDPASITLQREEGAMLEELEKLKERLGVQK